MGNCCNSRSLSVSYAHQLLGLTNGKYNSLGGNSRSLHRVVHINRMVVWE